MLCFSRALAFGAAVLVTLFSAIPVHAQVASDTVVVWTRPASSHLLPPPHPLPAPVRAAELSLKRHLLVGAGVGAVLGAIGGIIAYQRSPSCCYEADGGLRWAVPVYTIALGATVGTGAGLVVYGLRRAAQ